MQLMILKVPSGTALDYSTADKIQSFIDKGYRLVSDGVLDNQCNVW